MTAARHPRTRQQASEQRWSALVRRRSSSAWQHDSARGVVALRL